MEGAQTPDLTIAIGTLDNFPTLERCLRSIYDDATINFTFEVCVVYNGSGDESITAQIRKTFPAVRLIIRKGPLGYCSTYNLVLTESRSRYTLALDDDTILSPGTLSRMVAFMDAHPQVGISGCRTLNPDGTFQKTYGTLPRLATEWLAVVKPDVFWGDRQYRDLLIVKEVEWLSGSFMLVRAETLEQVGALDEYYYTAICEQDWCYRIRKAGWQVVYVPDVTIVHVGNQFSIGNKMRVTSEIAAIRYHVNRYFFFHKHYSPLALFLLRPAMILGCALRMIRYSIAYATDRKMRVNALARLKSSWVVIKLSISREPYKSQKLGKQVIGTLTQGK
jgi:hypothetical protein